MKNGLYVIFGTGPLGRSVMNELLCKGYSVRMVNRSGKANVPEEVEVVQADVLNRINMNESVNGASVVFQCVNPPYDRWPEQFPAMQNNILNAAATITAKLVIGENVYMYGDTEGKPLTEDLPYAAKTRKGKVRAQMSLNAMQAHRDGRIKIAIGRGSDFFGPFVSNSAMGFRQIGFALQGKKVSLTGNIDVPHTFTYINDFGKALVMLAENEKSFGETWHIPNAKPVTQREFITQVFKELGKEPAFSRMGKTMMRIGGLFIPAARETVEMMYEFEKPFIVDSKKFEDAFFQKSTPLKDAIRTTVEWYKQYYQAITGK
jgi:nucleoside-diphosphate-sugar epimerase